MKLGAFVVFHFFISGKFSLSSPPSLNKGILSTLVCSAAIQKEQWSACVSTDDNSTNAFFSSFLFLGLVRAMDSDWVMILTFLSLIAN